MDSSQPLIMKMLTAQMGYTSDRQGVLAQNMANIDTPGYEARDLKKLDFSRLAQLEANRLEVRATSAKHLSGTLAQDSDFKSEKNRKTFEETPVGNNVVLEEQMAKVSDTGAQFQMSSSLFRKYGQFYRIAADNRN